MPFNARKLLVATVFLLATAATLAFASTSSGADAGSVQSDDTAVASASASTQPAPPPSLVDQALAILHRLDRKHPWLHHAHHSVTQRALSPPSPAGESAAAGVWGWDMQVPDWTAWSRSLLSRHHDDDDRTSRRDLKAYITARDRALTLLRTAWEVDKDVDAGYLLGEFAMFGNYSTRPDLQLSFDIFSTLAREHGNATAQFYTGLFYATDLGGVVTALSSSAQGADTAHHQHTKPRIEGATADSDTQTPPAMASTASPLQTDQARAQLFLEFAAMGGHTGAQMTAAFRYHTGIGCSPDCEKSAQYYHEVAHKIMEFYYKHPPGGPTHPYGPVRLSDEDHGMFGPGSLDFDAYEHYIASPVSVVDWMLFKHQQADQYNDILAQVQLGYEYLTGSHSKRPNLAEAHKYFMRACRQYFSGPDDSPSASLSQQPDTNQLVAQAAGFLGRMYMRGDAVAANNVTAWQWFSRGAKLKDVTSMTWLAIMNMESTGNPQAKTFTEEERAKARQTGWELLLKITQKAHLTTAEAMAYVGQQLLHTGEYKLALPYLRNAAKFYHLPAMYSIARMFHFGIGTTESCPVAVAYFKLLVERGMEWIDPLFSPAFNLLVTGNPELSLLLYTLAAERGAEVAQSNVAWLIDTAQANATALVPNPHYFSYVNWNRAANQDNTDARVKVGDYHYYGRGVPLDLGKAAMQYHLAGDLHNGIALWNLGYMYEHGEGVAKDYHMAKRHYDHALTVNAEGWLPVKLSLFKLHLTNLGEFLFGSVPTAPPTPEKKSSEEATTDTKGQLPPAAPAQAAADKDTANSAQPATQDAEVSAAEQDDLERSYQSYKRLTRKRSGGWLSWLLGNDDDDHLRHHEVPGYHHPRHNHQQRRTHDTPQADDLGDGFAAPQHDHDRPVYAQFEDDDEDMENMIILLLCLVIGYLVYLRQLRFGQANRNQQQQQQQQQQPPQPPGPFVG
ncbi:ERAD-associated protein [Sorochytrium milnesiophthora]